MSGIKRTVTSDRFDATSTSFIHGPTVSQLIGYAQVLREATAAGLDPGAVVQTDDLGNGWKRFRATSGGLATFPDEEDES